MCHDQFVGGIASHEIIDFYLSLWHQFTSNNLVPDILLSVVGRVLYQRFTVSFCLCCSGLDFIKKTKQSKHTVYLKAEFIRKSVLL